MKFAHALITAVTVAAIASAPAWAGLFDGLSSSGGHDSSSSSRGDHGHTSTSSSGDDGHGSSTGGMPSSSTSSTSGGTSIPEPSDAILLLMGAAGVVIGRRLHARARRRP